MDIHGLSMAFPPMSADEYSALRADMMLNGYDPNFPVVLYEGLILDGRHRWRAAVEIDKTGKSRRRNSSGTTRRRGVRCSGERGAALDERGAEGGDGGGDGDDKRGQTCGRR